MYAALAWAVILLVGCLGEEVSTNNEATLVCSPKGLLQLDKPFPSPGTHKTRLPFCSKFGCGCCGQRSVRIIARAVTEGWSDESLPDTCRAVLEQMYCSVCDPQVGTDSQPVCEDTCKLWWTACKDAFFSIDVAGNLVPCGAAASTHLICSQLKALAPEHKQLCTLAGYTVSSTTTTDCYSGVPNTPTELCSSEFDDPDSYIFEDESEAPPQSGLAAMIESASDIRMVLRGIMVIAFITFVVKRFALHSQQNQVMMQRLELHQQRMRLQNQQRKAAAAAALLRQEAGAREKTE